jgi:protein arginine N-methyltransferase 1
VPYSFDGGSIDIAVSSTPARGAAPELWPSVGEYPCYDPFLYHAMTDDAVRNRAFRRALSPWVEGRHVLDIGTGQDLNWALEAARLGARVVTAVEVMPATYERALEHLAGRPEAQLIDVVNASSFDLQLDERADVCVAEVIGSVASAEGMLATVADARRRLLQPGAVIVPGACDTIVGAISLRGLFPGGVAFAPDAVPYLTKIFDLYGQPFDIRLALANVDPTAVTSTTAAVEQLKFDGTTRLDDTSDVRIEMSRDGEVDGLLCWIRLFAGAGAPPIDSLSQRTSWIPAYLPLFDRPVVVAAGDPLELRFGRHTSDDGIHPDYVVDAALDTSTGSVRGTFRSYHHTSALRSAAIYRDLFRLPASHGVHGPDGPRDHD